MLTEPATMPTDTSPTPNAETINPPTDTSPTPNAEQFADDAFHAVGVDDFGSAGEFTGTLPGEQAPQTSAPTNDLDALMAGIDMRDPLDAFKVGEKVKFTGNIIAVREVGTSLVVDIMPTSPPTLVALGVQGVFFDIKGKNAVKGKSEWRAIHKAAGTDPLKPSALIGKIVVGNASKSKKGDKMFLNF